MNKRWRILRQEHAYQGFFKLNVYEFEHERFDGGVMGPLRREVFERGTAAAVLPYDPNTKRFLLVEQFRPGAMQREGSPWLTELVAGIVESGETAEEVVIREMQEEAGQEIASPRLIQTFYPSPGGCTEKISLFFCEADLSGAGGVFGLCEEGEDIKVHLCTLEAAWEALTAGEIDNAMTLIAIQWFFLHHPDGRAFLL